MPLPTENYLSEVCEILVQTGTNITKFRCHKDDIDEWLEKITFSPHQFYETRKKHLQEIGSDINHWCFGYARDADYLFCVSNIQIC